MTHVSLDHNHLQYILTYRTLMTRKIVRVNGKGVGFRLLC
jgi:hypothetical protein